MRVKRQSHILSAAYEVLSKARRSMHYTQIASVGKRLGILQSDSASIDVMMSSLLSQDIRRNPESAFVKERPGVYALSARGIVGSSEVKGTNSDSSSLLNYLHERTGIFDRSRLLNKALYVTGRTLDMAGSKGVSFYSSLDHSQSIKVDLPNLVEEFERQSEQRALDVIGGLRDHTLRVAKQTASRLGLEDLWLAVRISLFLLELATDVVGTETLLVIKSSTSSIRLPVRSGSRYGS